MIKNVEKGADWVVYLSELDSPKQLPAVNKGCQILVVYSVSTPSDHQEGQKLIVVNPGLWQVKAVYYKEDTTMEICGDTHLVGKEGTVGIIIERIA